MRRLLFMLLFAATTIAQPIRQEKSLTLYTPPTSTRSEPPTARVRALIRQLAASNLDARAAAERELLSLCPAIEPQLRFALAQEEKSAPAPLPMSAPLTQEYVRGGAFSRFQPADLLPRPAFHSLEALLERCGELRHTKPALVTINATNAPLAEIFRQLGEQTGAPVSVVARSDYAAVTPVAFDWFQSARATVQLHRVPYWSALRTILGAISSPANGTQLFVNIGSNHLRLIPASSGSADVFRNQKAVSAGPMLLLAGYQTRPQPRVMITAVLDPALTGFTGDSSLQLASATDAHGHSLLREGDHTSSSGGLDDKDRDASLGYAFDPADGEFSWRQSIPIQGSDAAAIAGAFSIGFGVNSKDRPFSQYIGIPLAPFHPESLAPIPAEEQIYVLQDCKILQPPSVDKPVYAHEQPDCETRSIERRDGPAGRETIEGRVLTLTNHRDHPVTYVAGLAYFYDPAPGFPKPDQIVEMVGIYHAHAEPGQTVEIRMATVYERGMRPPVPQVPDRLPALPSTATPQTVVCDGWRLSVLSVSRTGEAYEIAGQVAMPTDGPFGDTAVGAGYIFLSPLDTQGWQIESYPHFSRLRREGDHLVEDFTVVTREPGRIPATLLWQTPSATHWLSSTVEIRHLN
jgi:hypothetical protein